MAHDPNYVKKDYPVKGVPKRMYDAERHCGKPTRAGIPCTMLKGQGTDHPGEGACKLHGGNVGHGNFKTGIYSHIKRNRLKQLIEKVRDSGMDPLDILGELEIARAMLMMFLEDHANLDDREDRHEASELIDKITRAAFMYQKMQQSDMIHVKLVELIHMRMADVVIRVINMLDPDQSTLWKQLAIQKIRDQWGMIQIETSPRELKRVFEQVKEEGVEVE